jgi:hypothetical protein
LSVRWAISAELRCRSTAPRPRRASPDPAPTYVRRPRPHSARDLLRALLLDRRQGRITSRSDGGSYCDSYFILIDSWGRKKYPRGLSLRSQAAGTHMGGFTPHGSPAVDCSGPVNPPEEAACHSEPFPWSTPTTLNGRRVSTSASASRHTSASHPRATPAMSVCAEAPMNLLSPRSTRPRNCSACSWFWPAL